MRRDKAVSAAVVMFTLLSVSAVACAPGGTPDESTESTSEALTRRGVTAGGGATVVVDPPPTTDPGVKPPKVLAPPATTAVVDDTYCGGYQFDLRRTSRTCEDLPGAIVEKGITYVSGATGRFRVARTFAGSVPPELDEKSCSYFWESSSCSLPEKNLLLEDWPNEQLIPRMPGCEHLGPSGCMIVTPPPTSGGIPSGVGRCEVCGYSTNNAMWAVLPSTWTSFSYNVGGVHYSVTPAAGQTTYSVPLSGATTGNVTLYQYNAAP